MASLYTFALASFAIVASAIPQTAESVSTSHPFTAESPITASTVTTAHPTGPVITINAPDFDTTQILVGSLIGITSSLTTVAIACPDGTDSNDCGFNPPITITAGPSTFAFAISYDPTDQVTQDCKLSAGGASCDIVEIGSLATLETATNIDASTLTGLTTISSSIIFNATDIVAFPITITAGQTAELSGAASATTGSSSVASASSGSASHSSARSGSSATGATTGATTGASSTATHNDAKILLPGSFVAGLMGFAALLL